MNKINFRDVLPLPFVNQPLVESTIWNKTCTFEKGKKYLIEATSGTGKSSLCAFIYGLRNDYKGDIYFDDQKTQSLKTKQWFEVRQKHISLLFQDLRLFPELNAWDNVQIKNQLTHFKTESQIKAMFHELQICECLERKVEKLSIGQQQRIAFIRALCQPFDFILLDEPISHVDAKNAVLMVNLLEKELEQQKAAAIVTSVGNRLSLTYSKILQL
jgi:ABC-type lipoprotein export system ATPase subunit